LKQGTGEPGKDKANCGANDRKFESWDYDARDGIAHGRVRRQLEHLPDDN
jgi:hypothetical protein